VRLRQCIVDRETISILKDLGVGVIVLSSSGFSNVDVLATAEAGVKVLCYSLE